MLIQVLITAAGLGLSSLIGSAIGLAVRRIPHKWNDIFMGFCAGTMLAAAIVGLLIPSVSGLAPLQWWQPIAGVVAGVALIGALDYVTPHLHRLSGLEMERHRASDSSVNRILMFVIAIALHKLPEGMATGIVFDEDNMSNAYAVAISIALQNVPEGLVIVTPLLMVGVSYMRATVIALAIALLEMAGVGIGYMLGSVSGMFLPALLAMSGGAMLYVISDEMIPETHAHGFQKPATYALVAGVLVTILLTSVTGA